MPYIGTLLDFLPQEVIAPPEVEAEAAAKYFAVSFFNCDLRIDGD